MKIKVIQGYTEREQLKMSAKRVSGVRNERVNISSTGDRTTSEGTRATVFNGAAIARVAEETNERMDGAASNGIRITKSQLKKILVNYSMSRGCTEECKKRQLEWQEEKLRLRKEMNDIMAKLKLVALDIKWIAKMVAEKLPSSALKEYVHEAMVVMDEICTSKKTREESGQQVLANGTEKAARGPSPSSLSASTPGDAMRVSSETSRANTIASLAPLGLRISRNGSANLGGAGDSMRRHNLEDTAAVQVKGVKKCRKNGPQESKDSAFFMDDFGSTARGQEISDAQTAGGEVEGSKNSAVALNGGDSGHKQDVNQSLSSCISLNDAMVVRVHYFRNESTGEMHREHPLRFPVLNASTDMPILEIELGNGQHDVAKNKRVLLEVRYDFASNDQKVRIFYYMRSIAESVATYGWQSALCAPCTVGQLTKVLLVFDPRQNFVHDVLFVIGYVECGGGRRGRWSDVCFVNLDECNRIFHGH
uniref:Uncharacterized protein n=2 Tax=Parascaris univalens TaxID=6257 RepID=A0A915AEJ1_PARUN